MYPRVPAQQSAANRAQRRRALGHGPSHCLRLADCLLLRSQRRRALGHGHRTKRDHTPQTIPLLRENDDPALDALGALLEHPEARHCDVEALRTRRAFAARRCRVCAR